MLETFLFFCLFFFAELADEIVFCFSGTSPYWFYSSSCKLLSWQWFCNLGSHFSFHRNSCIVYTQSAEHLHPITRILGTLCKYLAEQVIALGNMIPFSSNFFFFFFFFCFISHELTIPAR